jgi:dTDP-4-dehydrorhamnose 3,5-epimerase
MDQINFTELKRMHGDTGSVFHVMQNCFGKVQEVYVSTVNQGSTKGWKKHLKMTLNLTVIKGEVNFFIKKGRKVTKYSVGDSNYGRLTIPPNYWVAFEGVALENIIINCADLIHDPEEAENRKFEGLDENMFDGG